MSESRPETPFDQIDHVDRAAPWLALLGLPFYYRHQAAPATRRAVFWLGAIGTVGLFAVNAVWMPSVDGTELNWIYRNTVLGDFGRYMTMEEGMRSLFLQCYVLAAVLSGIFAPLYATFSLANERVSRTMEFLRLSPMPTLGVVIGKLIAPGLVLHQLAGAFVLLGTAAAFFGEMPFYMVLTSLLSVTLTALFLHAVGGLIVSLSTAFRGFFPVGVLIVVGFFWLILPYPLSREVGMSFLGHLSPFASVYIATESVGSAWVPALMPQWFGEPMLTPVFLLLFYGMLSGLAVYGAARRLDHPEKSVLPRLAWLALFGATVLVCIGVLYNQPVRLRFNYYSGAYNSGGRMYLYGEAAAMLLTLCIPLCLLALIDHPYDRQTLLTDECERLAGHDTRKDRSWYRRFGHGAFVALLTLATGIAAILIVRRLPHFADSEANRKALNLFYFVAFGCAGVVYLAASLIEAIWIRYSTTFGRVLAGCVAALLLGICLLGPMIDAVRVLERWNMSLYFREQVLAMEAVSANQAGMTPQQRQDLQQRYNQQMYWMSRSTRYPMYSEHLQTKAEVEYERKTFRERPFALYWHYHRTAALTFMVLALSAVAAVLWWRRRAYVLLRREAEKAMADYEPLPPPSRPWAPPVPEKKADPAGENAAATPDPA